MRAVIRPRAQAALAGLAVLLTVAIIVAALMFVLLRLAPSHSNSYQTYGLDVTPTSPWHTGQSLTLEWLPSVVRIDGLSGSPPPVPHSVSCTFAFYGPYATQAAAQADASLAPAEGSTTLAGTPLAASAPPLTLSTAFGTVPSPESYALPGALAPSYYVAMGFAGDVPDVPIEGVSNLWVVEVTA